MRPLDEHLSPQELVELPDTQEALASSSQGQQIEQHLRQCEECMGLAHTHWRLRGLRTSAAAGGEGVEKCPSETEWLEFALGLRARDADRMAEHAAQCEVCAAAWKEAMELATEQPGEAEALAELLPTLASSSPEWQQNMIAQLASQTAEQAGADTLPVSGFVTASSTHEDASPQTASSFPRSPSRRPSLLVRWLPGRTWFQLTAVAAMLVVAVLVGVFTWRSLHPSEARLLAMAYNKQRTLPLRVPGADPVPMASGTRAANSSLPETTELIELRLRAQQHLDQTPNSPYWHQIMGEIDLLHQDGLAARRNFEIAQTTDENLPNLLTDLAAAWFEIGDSTGNTEAYAQAAEFYSKELHGKPADPALLYYNRAICWERLSLTENALDDLRAALPLERSKAWQKVIQAAIDRLSTHSNAVPNDGYETALAEATEKLLPQWSTSPEARASIERTAQLGLRHQDHWLTDWIHAPHTPETADADRHLASAITSANTGGPQQSLTEAREAITFYAQAHHQPGKLRAQMSEVYALQRLQDARDCLRAIPQPARDASVHKYAWLAAQLIFEECACEAVKRNFDQAVAAASRALAVTKEHDLSDLAIRMLAAKAYFADQKGAHSSAWHLDVLSLQNCGAINCSPNRRYQSIFNLTVFAQDIHLPFVAAEVMRTATQVAASTGDAILHAYALELLGILQGRVGNYTASDAAFSEAQHLAETGNRAPMFALYQAEWRSDRAAILTRKGDTQRALELLQQAPESLLASDYQLGRINYFVALASAQRAAGHDPEALEAARSAVGVADRTLATLASTPERESWSAENAAPYAELIETYWQRHEPDQALAAWEHYRGGPYSTPSAPNATSGAPVSPSGEAGTDRVLIVAGIREHYIAWLATGRPLHLLQSADLGPRARLQQLAMTFYRLCSNRSSNITDIHSVGAVLHSVIFQPFAEQLSSTSHLLVDVDPSLEMLPLAAITNSHGKWLGTSVQITLLPPWWTLENGNDSSATFTPEANLVAVSGFDSQDGGGNTASVAEASDIAHLFRHPLLLTGHAASAEAILRSIPSADVFHFSGHARSGATSQLALPPEDGRRTIGLDAASITALHHIRCRMAVLAACNTNAADPDRAERILGLRESLLLSGTRTVIASNWDVDDRSTHALIMAFYHNLLSGNSPDQSLQSAQSSLQNSPTWNHPYYWSSFESFTH